jgi:hypothetical protein
MKTQFNTLLTLAEGPTLPGKVIKVIRQQAKNIQDSIKTMVGQLEDGELKTELTEVDGSLKTLLSGLPAAEAEADNEKLVGTLLEVIGVSQRTMDHLNAVASEALKSKQVVLAGLDSQIEQKINERISTGDLLTRADAEKQRNDAVATARGEAAQQVKQVGERRLSLSSIQGLPVPADDLLIGDDKDYGDRKTKAQERAKKLQGFKLSGDRLTTLCWKVDDTQFDEALGLLTEAAGKPKEKEKAKPGPIPFVHSRGQVPALRRRIGCV